MTDDPVSMTVTGIGAGFNEVLAFAATIEAAPNTQRGRWVAAINIPSFICGVIVLTQHDPMEAGIRSGAGCLTILLPELGFIFLNLCYDSDKDFQDPNEHQESPQTRKRIDYPGVVLASLTTAFITLAFALHEWKSRYSFMSLSIGVICLFLFLFFRSRRLIFGADAMLPNVQPGSPFQQLPLKYVQVSTAPLVLIEALLLTFLATVTFSSVSLFLGTQNHVVLEHEGSPQAILRMLSWGAVPIGAAISSACFDCGRRRTSFWTSLIMLSISWLLLASGCLRLLWTPKLSEPITLAMISIAEMGFGSTIAISTILCTFLCSSEMIATIIGFSIATRSVAMSIGYTA